MFALITRTLSPAPAASLAQVARFRGVARGWEPLGRTRTPAQAARLAALVARIHPTATLRVRHLAA